MKKTIGSILPFIFLFVLVGVFCVADISTEYKCRNKRIKRMILIFTLICFSYVVLRITVLGRTSRLPRITRTIPFQSYYNYLYNWSVYLFVQNILNVLMFFPFGFFGSVLFEKQPIHLRRMIVIGTALFISITVEIIQYVKAIGVLETDDVIHNIFGAFCGCVLYELVCCIVVRRSCVGHWRIQIIDYERVVKILKGVLIIILTCIFLYIVAYVIHWYRIDYFWYIRN